MSGGAKRRHSSFGFYVLIKTYIAIAADTCVIPKHKMATPFCVFKTLTGFGFRFTKVLPHFRELVLGRNQNPIGERRRAAPPFSYWVRK
ncbi:MAG: hypothetical protein RLZZ139_3302 [Cyanobacteriota bacterium]